MFNDFKILQLITKPNLQVSIPKAQWLEALHLIVEWSFSEKATLWRRVQTLSEKELKIILNSVNHWRNEAKLSPIKKSTQKLLQIEIAHLAKLKAKQLAAVMAKKGTTLDKKKWITESLSSEFFIALSKKTFLGDECLDKILGLNERKIKLELFGKNLKSIYRNEDIYLDLDPEDLFTPYRVIADISDKLNLKPGALLVDLGSGVGRVGIVMGILNPKLKFVGLELMKERHFQAQQASKKLGLDKRIQFQCCDLSKNKIPLADCYYLFNPFSYLTLRRVFQSLYVNSESKPFRVLMAQVGRPPRMVKRHPWLTQTYLSPLDRNWRAHGFSIYQSR